jgi:type IV pilus assembly protein PilE
MYRYPKQFGFTLIEIMVAVAIIAIVVSVAIPAYNGYIHTARMSEGQDNLGTLRLAQIEFFDENDSFFIGAGTAAVIAASGNRWRPTPWDVTLTNAQNIANLNFTYTVTNCAGGAVDGAGNPTQCFIARAVGQNLLDPVNDTLQVTN